MQRSAKRARLNPPVKRERRLQSPQQPNVVNADRNDASSKQARVITMLQSPAGMTIAAMMKETGWQQHSVRGFLAGVVRKKLKLKLSSKKIDGNRVYCIGGSDSAKSTRPIASAAGLTDMPRVKIGPAQPDRKTIDIEIARLRDLDVGDLRARWHTVLRRRPSPHLPRHLLFRVLAYRLQADRLGDLDAESRRLLDGAGSPDDAGKRAVDPGRLITDVRPGTVLAREWNGQMQRVTVLGRWLRLERQDLSQPVQDRLRHHRHPLERAQVLRAARQAIEGGAVMNSGRIEARFAAPSTPGSPPTKDWNRTSTPWTPNTMPRRPISAAKRMPAGRWSGPNMMMAASPAAIPTGRRCSGCLRTCGPARSTSSSSIRSTG